MAEENKQIEEKSKENIAEAKIETKAEEKKEEVAKPEEKIEKVEEKKEKKEKIKKIEAFVKAENAKVSTKHSMAFCDWIRGKNIDESIAFIEKVKIKKKALPMKGEIPHRKGGFIGRYPENASIEFIKLLKSLRANVIYNGMDLDKTKIIYAVANIGNRPYKRFGSERSKRTHILIKAREAGKAEEKK